jgi:hypothetical protein
MSSSDTVQPVLDRAQRRALALGAVGIVVAVLLGWRAHDAVIGWQKFFQSYLFAYVFWTVVSLGCLGVLMLHHMTGGWWGYPIRRIVEAGSRLLPFMAVLFIPLVFGLGSLYEWAQPDKVAGDPILEYKKPYLNPSFFTARTIAYFAIWILLVYLFNKWSADEDRTGDPRLHSRMSSLAAPGFVIWAITMTGAMIDWVMSLDARWFSTIYGLIFMISGGLAAMSLSAIVVRFLSDYEPLKDCVEPKRFIDLGNLMLAQVLLWTYMSFSQFLIIWSGNLKNEIPWYKERAVGKWGAVAATLLILHFFVPFFLLLQRGMKRRIRNLAVIATLLLLLTLVDVYWQIEPAYSSAPELKLLDVFAVIGIGGLWVAAFLGQLKKRPLLPLHDPRFEAVLEHQHGD